ncbi:MAG: PaaI family thioesterase [Thermoleophilaceae bacterium]
MRALKRRGESGVEPSGDDRAAAPHSPFAVKTGLKLVSAEADRATGTLHVRRESLTESGIVRSDAISALVQATAAAAAGGQGWESASLSDIYITFVQPAPQHPLTAEGRVVPDDGPLRRCEVEVRDWNGDLVAKGLLSYRF